MVEWLLFDRVDTKTRAASVRIENHLVSFDFSNKAETAIPFLQIALTRAQIAYDSVGRIVSVPPLSQMRLNYHLSFVAKRYQSRL